VDASPCACATATAPPPAQRPLHIDPYPFLAHLSRWAAELRELPTAYDCAITPGEVIDFAREVHGDLAMVPGLRPSQRKAIATCRRRLALIWGPPGTGKTFTLGGVIAAHLAANRRVLALSTTNVAVDLITLAADDAWRALSHPPRAGEILRAGRPQHPALLEGDDRRHLLRWTEALDAINHELADYHRERETLARALQDEGLTAARRAKLAGREAEVAEAIRELELRRSTTLGRLASKARCVATTFTSYLANTHLQNQDFAVTVVDETSMVPAAAVCRLMADRRESWVFAGDFQQLPPVCQAARCSAAAANWMGKSFFDHLLLGAPSHRNHLRRADVLAVLTEQSRMVIPLCEVVSNTFYDSLLTTVNPPPLAGFDRTWSSAAIIIVDPTHAPTNDGHATAPRPQRAGTGAIWDRSAQLIRALVQRLLDAPSPPSTIAAITPYRSQAQLLDALVTPLDADRIRAGTIHRMQGSEADVVFLDPVRPADWFPGRSPDAARLINVAVRRARRQLILVGSPDELARNPHLAPFVAAADLWQPE